VILVHEQRVKHGFICLQTSDQRDWILPHAPVLQLQSYIVLFVLSDESHPRKSTQHFQTRLDTLTGQGCEDIVRFKVLTAASMKFRVFWDVVPCGHVEVD
jgi:hypothetical protein